MAITRHNDNVFVHSPFMGRDMTLAEYVSIGFIDIGLAKRLRDEINRHRHHIIINPKTKVYWLPKR